MRLAFSTQMRQVSWIRRGRLRTEQSRTTAQTLGCVVVHVPASAFEMEARSSEGTLKKRRAALGAFRSPARLRSSVFFRIGGRTWCSDMHTGARRSTLAKNQTLSLL